MKIAAQRTSELGSLGRMRASISRKLREIFLAALVIAIIAALLLDVSVFIFGGGSAPQEPGKLVGAIVFLFIMTFATVGVIVLPCALVMGITIALLKRWSIGSVVALVAMVTLCSSVTSYLLDPTASKGYHGAAGYFERLDWFASQFNVTGIVVGVISSLTAFAIIQRRRRSYANAA